MKKILSISICVILLLLPTIRIYADDECSLALNEAKTYYHRGEYQQAKQMFDYVVKYCGASYGEASNWSRKCQEMMTPSLSVSKTNISASASGTTESITVSCNRDWFFDYPYGNGMYSVTRNGNTLTVYIYDNTFTVSRTGSFYVKTTDGSKLQEITLSQAGKVNTSSSNTTAIIDNVWVEHNVYQNSEKGMKIHVHFYVNNMLNRTGRVSAYFYYDDNNSTPLKDFNQRYRTTDGKVSTGKNYTPGYSNCLYDDFVLFMPYTELHCTDRKTYYLKFRVSIWSDQNVEMVQSDWTEFTLTK